MKNLTTTAVDRCGASVQSAATCHGVKAAQTSGNLSFVSIAQRIGYAARALSTAHAACIELTILNATRRVTDQNLAMPCQGTFVSGSKAQIEIATPVAMPFGCLLDASGGR